MSSTKFRHTLPILILTTLAPLAAHADVFAYASSGSGKTYKVNLTQHTKIQIGAAHPTIGIAALALSDDGKLYGVAGGRLYLIDQQIGALTQFPFFLVDSISGQHRDFFAMASDHGRLIGASTTHDGTKTIYQINPANGVLTPFPALVNQEIQAITMLDSNTALVTTGQGFSVEKLNLQSGAITPVASLKAQCWALAVGSDSVIYGLGRSGQVYTISTTSVPAVTQVGTTPMTPPYDPNDNEWMDMAAIKPTFSSEVVNVANLEAYDAPGSLATVFGANFADQTVSAPSSPTSQSNMPLPASLGGVSVSIDGQVAPIYLAGTNQISFQVPYGLNHGHRQMTVTTPYGTSYTTIAVYPSAPVPFTGPSGGALATDAAGRPIDSTNKAIAGDTVIVYLIGAGPTDTPLPDGTPAPVSPSPRPSIPLTATIGGISAIVTDSHLTAGLVGVAQVEFIVPASLSGDQVLQIAPDCPTILRLAGSTNGVCDQPVSVTLPVRP